MEVIVKAFFGSILDVLDWIVLLIRRLIKGMCMDPVLKTDMLAAVDNTMCHHSVEIGCLPYLSIKYAIKHSATISLVLSKDINMKDLTVRWFNIPIAI